MAVTLGCLALNLSACSSESTDLVDPPVVFGAVETDGGNTVIEFNPKVDILFVIDDSHSMKPHQERLVENILKVEEIFHVVSHQVNLRLIRVGDNLPGLTGTE